MKVKRTECSHAKVTVVKRGAIEKGRCADCGAVVYRGRKLDERGE